MVFMTDLTHTVSVHFSLDFSMVFVFLHHFGGVVVIFCILDECLGNNYMFLRMDHLW